MTSRRGFLAAGVLVVLLGACITILLVAFPWLLLGKEVDRGREDGDYSFDASSILGSIDRGGHDVFLPMVAFPEPSTMGGLPNIIWAQEDFLEVANLLHIQLWGESLYAWNLDYIVFFGECGGAGQGFESAIIRSWMPVAGGLGGERLVHEISIRPLQEWISWSELRRSPRIEPWISIDLSQSQVQAETAVGLADEAGGYQIRDELDDACGVTAALPSRDRAGYPHTWLVRYMEPEMIEIASFQVDAITGDVR